jgi:WD40 repeat protein
MLKKNGGSMKNISIKTLVASLLLIGATSVLAMEQTQESVKRFNSGAKTGVRSICFSSDGKQIIGSVDDKAMVWDSQNRDVLYTLPGSTGQVVTDAKLNRDGSLILIASHKDAFIWDVRTKNNASCAFRS